MNNIYLLPNSFLLDFLPTSAINRYLCCIIHYILCRIAIFAIFDYGCNNVPLCQHNFVDGRYK